ncbi:hypothetical protein [Heyndrickxia ginsengihumi]|uniref:hypothetical protein n=1 Tax=Heyndrickxia ginsengihumi TaxID=363870 RepID=UPI0004BBB473|nr:hypothetical protein [Heyndrickxia ginsengihumi]
MLSKRAEELQNIIFNLQKQGKSQEQIKKVVSLYLIETKKKINPNGDLDII